MQVDPDSAIGQAPVHWLAVAVSTPAHSSLAEPLTYRADQALAPGTLVRVPLGAREVLGVVWANDLPAPAAELAAQVRPIAGALDGLSIGFRTRRARRSGPLRVLSEVDLIEVSLVPRPLLPQARFAPVS